MDASGRTLLTDDVGCCGSARSGTTSTEGAQEADGYFGPHALRTALHGGPDVWPHMVMIQVLRSYQEYTGEQRVLDFLLRFCGYLSELGSEVFGRGWGAYRVGDLIDVVCWLYEHDPRTWLLDLVDRMHHGSADFTSGIPTPHNVNIAQGFREPAQYALLATDQEVGQSAHSRYTAASYRNYETVMARYGSFPGGGFAGDEKLPGGTWRSTAGLRDLRDRRVHAQFRTAHAADRRGVRYLVAANGVHLDRTQHRRGQFENHFPMQAYLPGVHNEPTAYRCCPHNYGIGWPMFVRESWLTTPDGGVCASMYAPSTVTVPVGSSATEVTLTADTACPFEETITVDVSVPHGAVTFPLWLRVPSWCTEPTVQVNGQPMTGERDRVGYLRIHRAWRDSDTVTLRFPMNIEVLHWQDQRNAVSVRRGPLHCSLAIDEQWRTVTGEESWPWFEVRPGSPWNYGLELPSENPERMMTVRERPEGTSRESATGRQNPFTPEGVPWEIQAPGRRIEQWQLDPDHVVPPLQTGPIASDAPAETVRLIPAGAARSRITMFPRIGEGDARTWDPSVVTASACWAWDQVGGTWGPSGNGRSSVDAVNGQHVPTSSHDPAVPRLLWAGHQGTEEWVVHDFIEPSTVSEFGVYWFADADLGGRHQPPSR